MEFELVALPIAMIVRIWEWVEDMVTAPVNDYENQLPKSTKSGQNQSSVHYLFITVEPIITAKKCQNSTSEQESGKVHYTTNH